MPDSTPSPTFAELDHARDILAELAIRRFVDDSYERFVEATWPLRAEVDRLRAKFAGLTASDLLRQFQAIPASTIIRPGESPLEFHDVREVRELTADFHIRAERATAGIVRATKLRWLPSGDCTIATEPLDLCVGEPFSGQPRGPNCTGVLVAPDLIVTAGHFMFNRVPDSIYFVFDYALGADDRVPQHWPASSVYRGQEIVHIRYERDVPGADWAIVRLDRPVAGRRPLRVRRTGRIGDESQLYTMGHPAGLPKKITDDGQVYDNSPAESFKCSLDMVAGGSGSPVFVAGSDRVEGIVVYAKEGWMTGVGYCKRYHLSSDVAEDGTVVTRATEFAHLLPELGS